MENLDFALRVLVLGFLVVMVTLFGLYAILVLFNRFLYRTPSAPAEKKTALRKKTVPEQESEGEERRLVAAITAAVYQYLQTEQSHLFSGPISIAVHPSGGMAGNEWKVLGRKELLESSLELENIRRKKKLENI